MTGLSPPEHEHSAAIDEAAVWLASDARQRINRPLVPWLKERFGLTTIEAIEAIKTANERRGRAA